MKMQQIVEETVKQDLDKNETARADNLWNKLRQIYTTYA